ncbi:MAG: 16S rRNA (uracil(1498)-N(3))-methyltransferase, partial [Thermodesulfobacteriota bacterium]
EVNLAEKNGFISLGLGKRILRAETAAITMVSLLQFKFGDLG